MVTVNGSNERKYEVRSQLYGTRNLVHRLYYGGVFLASTGARSADGASETSMMETIRRADKVADELGIDVTE